MNNLVRATARGSEVSSRSVSPIVANRRSEFEVQNGATTLVVVDMQQTFLNNWTGPSQPPIDAVIRQVKEAIRLNWSIVLLEMKPWRLGETISPIADLLEGYPRCQRRSKQTPSGAKQLVEVCDENSFGKGLFRFVGVFLDACVLETVRDLLEAEPCSLVRMIVEGCSTDIDVPGAWSWVRQRLEGEPHLAISSEAIDRQ
ncbi:MAG: cysteine hydrolase [Cyanobacteria bacterium REEB67]|nr:cysteine hydrolase [Cyanobacteria bacterium REEB67]